MKTHRFLILLLILFLLQCQNRAPKISQGRESGGNSNYTGDNLLKSWPQNGPDLIWIYEDLGKGYSTVAVTSEGIFTTGIIDSTGYLYALDHNGNLLWKKDYGYEWTGSYPGTRATPLIFDGLGYMLSGRGLLLCFDIANGNVVWQTNVFTDYDGQNVDFGITENLLIDGDKLFCTPGGKEANVIALNRLSGELIWKSHGNGELSAYCTPITIDVNGRKFFVTITRNSAISIDIETGSLTWAYDLGYPYDIHGNMPVFKDGLLFTQNGWEYGSVMLKISGDGAEAEEAWKSHHFDLCHGGVVKIGDNLYGTDYTQKQFVCVDWNTGLTIDSLDAFAPGTVIEADSMIYCYSYAGEMALIKPAKDGFEVVSSFKLPGKKKDHFAHPVIKNGKLYIRYSKTLRVYSIMEI